MKGIGEVAKVIDSWIKYLTLLLKTSHVRRMRKAVNYGETFIRLFFKEYVNADEEDQEDILKRLERLEKKFFKYNQ